MFFQDKLSHSTDWISFLVIGVFLVLGVMHYLNSFSLKAIFNDISLTSVSEEKIGIKNLILNLVFLSVIALMVLLFVRRDSEIRTDDWVVYLKIILGIGFLLIAQRLATILHGALTKARYFFAQYSKLRSKYFQLSASIMLPFLLLGMYAPVFNSEFILISIVVFSVVYALGVLKTLRYSKVLQGQFKYHIIIYICAIEIMPLLILYKQLT